MAIAVQVSAAGGGRATTVTTGNMNVTSGWSVYVVILEFNISDVAGAPTDNVAGSPNTYLKKATYATANGTIVVYACDNVTGSATLAITVTSTMQLYNVVAMAISGTANPSFDKAGSGANGAYITTTVESDSLAPSSGSGLLFGAFNVFASNTAGGGPTVTFTTPSGMAQVNHNSASYATTHQTVAGCVYDVAASGTGSQTVSGSATVVFTGTAAYVILGFAVLPFVASPSSGATTLLLGVGVVLAYAVRSASRAARRFILSVAHGIHGGTAW